MADFALLDELGFDKLFYYRKEVAKYRGMGMSDQELEEAASDILLDQLLKMNWEKNTQKQFCVFCKLALRQLRRINKKRYGMSQKLTRVKVESLVDTADHTVPLNFEGLLGERFRESLGQLLETVFQNDPKFLSVAQKHFVEGHTLQQVADELGYKFRQSVHLVVGKIRERLREWISYHRRQLYWFFGGDVADTIIEIARV